MKKLVLVISLIMVGLSGCYVTPNRGHIDGTRRDRDHHDHRYHGPHASTHRRDRDDHDKDQGRGYDDRYRNR